MHVKNFENLFDADAKRRKDIILIDLHTLLRLNMHCGGTVDAHKPELLKTPGPEVIKLFSCSAQLRLKFILLINVKMPTIVGILTFISKINYRLW